MLVIPIQAVAAQELTVSLAGQSCIIILRQKRSGLYCDLSVNNVLIIGGAICQNLNRIVRSTYLGFIGDLCFIDNQGSSDPFYTGLGSRFTLAYLEQEDLE